MMISQAQGMVRHADLHDQSNDLHSTDSTPLLLVGLNEMERRLATVTNIICPAEECLSKEVVGVK